MRYLLAAALLLAACSSDPAGPATPSTPSFGVVAPVASFGYVCGKNICDFVADSPPDMGLVQWCWVWDAGQPNQQLDCYPIPVASHRYKGRGGRAHLVVLMVTADDGRSASAFQWVMTG